MEWPMKSLLRLAATPPESSQVSPTLLEPEWLGTVLASTIRYCSFITHALFFRKNAYHLRFDLCVHGIAKAFPLR